jgi:hypothetical protein
LETVAISFAAMPPKVSKQQRRDRKLAKTHTDGGTSVAPDSGDEAPGPAAAPSSPGGPMAVDGSAPHFEEVPSEESEVGERPSKTAKVSGPVAGAEEPASDSMLQVLLRMEKDFKNLGFAQARLEQRFEHQDDKFDALDRRIDSAVGAFDTRFETLKNEVNGKLAELSQATPPSTSASSGLPPGRLSQLQKAPFEKSSAAKGAAPDAPASSAGSPTIPKPAVHSSPTPVAGKNMNKLWIKGFGTTQTSMLMAVPAKAFIAALPPDLQAGARVQASGFGTAIAISFPSKEKADLAFPFLKELDRSFLDPRTEILGKLRVTKDLPFAVRCRNRIQGLLWTQVKDHLVKSKIDFNGLAVSNGTLFVIVGESPFEVFKIKTIKDGESSRFEASACPAFLSKFGISRELASDWAEEASGTQMG